jgi:hypothetical protein
MQFHCVGAPPERHADRVIAEMLRELAVRRAQLRPAIQDAFARSSDGSPRAQQKMATRIKQAGAVYVDLRPGKRGRYEIDIYEWMGWDPATDSEIEIGDAIPEKPWIACQITSVQSKGRGRFEECSWPFLFVTHHVLSRAAQRFGLRTSKGIEDTVRTIWNAAMTLLDKIDKDAWLSPPPWGHRLQLERNDGSKAVVVLRRHETHPALIAMTILGANR